MAKKLAKAAALILSGALLLAGAGCAEKETGGTTKEQWQAVIERYTSSESVMIAGWDNPTHSYAAYETAKDMGLTHMFMWGDRGVFTPGETVGSGSAQMEELQQWFTELGLKAIWQTGSDMNSTQAGTFNENLRNYSCVEGVDIFDEPRYTALDALQSAVQDFDEKYGDDLLCFFNLLPSSTSDIDLQSTYADYLEKVEEILGGIQKGRRMVSTDVYPLLQRGDDLLLDGSWLTNMYQLRTLADRLNAEFNMFIQSVGFNGHRKPETGKEIRFQVWTDFCFGITGYTYFTYANDPNQTGSFIYTDTICDKSGVPNNQEYFNGCKQVNEEVLALAPVYRSFDWEGVLVSYGSEGMQEIDAGLFNLDMYTLSSVDFLKSYNSQFGTVYGVYGAEDGGNALAITNYTDPYLNRSNTVRLTFNDADTVLMFRQGEWEYNRAVNGEFEVTLESGEGVFLIPCKLNQN